MKILYIHQYFRTPKQPGGTRSYWIAQELIKNGHSVTFVTTDKLQKSNSNEYTVDGINVVSYSVPYNQSMGIKERLTSYSKFMFQSSKYILKYGHNFDCVIATSTPLTVGVPALLGKWFKNLPYVFEVRDLWPEVPIQMGAFKNTVIIWLARLLEKTIYKNAIHIVALSPGMLDGVIKYVSRDKTSMIPNMSKVDKFWPREKNVDLMNKIGLKNDHLKIIHFGSLGEANGIDTVIDAAEFLVDEKIQFLFLGAGSTENRLKNRIKQKNINNVIFYQKVSMDLVSEIVNCCDISLVSFKDLPILYTNSPNKLFDSLSAGKPIIVNSAGWTKDLVERHNCGFYVNPNTPGDLVNLLKNLRLDNSILAKMGANSRNIAEKEYDKSILVTKFSKIINKIDSENNIEL